MSDVAQEASHGQQHMAVQYPGTAGPGIPAADHRHDVSGSQQVLSDHRRSNHGGGDHDLGKESRPAIRVLDKEMASYASTSTPVESSEQENEQPGSRYAKYWRYLPVAVWVIFTAWWIAGLVLHRHDKNWVIPFLLWLCITSRVMTLYLPASYIWRPVRWIWIQTIARAVSYVPQKFRIPFGALITIAIMVTGAFASDTAENNTRANRAVSLCGLAVFVFVLWATSRNRKRVNWHTVLVGLLLQYLIALFVLRTKTGYDVFSFLSNISRRLLSFAEDGVAFLTEAKINDLHWFLTTVGPSIIFWVALIKVLYHYGILPWVVARFARIFHWSMCVSGAEAVVAVASPFVGMGESALLIKPFVMHLTNAELHQVMCSGFATIAGNILPVYIGLGLNPQALVSSCVMSIPAALAFSHLRYPEEEETLTSGRIVIPRDDESRAANGLHAFVSGAWLGLKVAGIIIAALLCIVSAISLIDSLLTWWGGYIGLEGEHDLSIELILGYICYPIAFLLGVPRNEELLLVARLIGTKIAVNEFVAYEMLASEAQYISMSPRSQLIATYALCGFGNFGSLATGIGVLSQIAPSRSGDVSKVAMSALFTGIVSTLSSASIAGLLLQDQSDHFTSQG